MNLAAERTHTISHDDYQEIVDRLVGECGISNTSARRFAGELLNNHVYPTGGMTYFMTSCLITLRFAAPHVIESVEVEGTDHRHIRSILTDILVHCR